MLASPLRSLPWEWALGTRVAILLVLVQLAVVVPRPAFAQTTRDPAFVGAGLEARTLDRPIRELAVSPEDLGEHWLLIPESVQELDSRQLGRALRPSEPLALFQARYFNETDYHPGRETAFLVAEFQDEDQAGAALHGYLDYIVIGNRMPEIRWRWAAERVATGDEGVRFGYCVGGEFTAGYLFRIGTFVGGVLMRGSEGEEEDLLAEVTTVTAWQEAMLLTEAPLARSSPW
jgi:hypothetical protein